jgi:hypothetical protein
MTSSRTEGVAVPPTLGALVDELSEKAGTVAEMKRLAEGLTMMAVNNGEPWMYQTAAELKLRARWIEESTIEKWGGE